MAACQLVALGAPFRGAVKSSKKGRASAVVRAVALAGLAATRGAAVRPGSAGREPVWSCAAAAKGSSNEGKARKRNGRRMKFN